MKKIAEILKGNLRQYVMIIALIVIVIYFQITTEGVLLKPMNISNLISQNAYILILATGMLLCILTGGNVDLSVGSVAGFVGAVAGVLIIKENMPVMLAIGISLLIGVIIGMWNGFWIAYMGVPAFITTLAGMLLFRGLTMVILEGTSLAPFPEEFTFLSSGFFPDFSEIKNIEIIALLVGLLISAAFVAFVLLRRKTKIENNINVPSFKNCITFIAIVVLSINAISIFVASGLAVEIGKELEINMFAILSGVSASLIYLLMMFDKRKKKESHGLKVPAYPVFIMQVAVIILVVLQFTYNLALYKGIPVVLILVVFLILLYSFITNKTIPGRHIYAFGGNPKAAQLSGVNTKRVMFWVYTNMGLLAAVAGIIFTGRLNSSTPKAGINFELDAIGACFIGGASTSGGIGTVIGAIVGGLLMGVLNNGMSILGVSIDWQQAIKGLVLLAAVAFDVYSKSKSKI